MNPRRWAMRLWRNRPATDRAVTTATETLTTEEPTMTTDSTTSTGPTAPTAEEHHELTRRQAADLAAHRAVGDYPPAVRDLWRILVETPAAERPALLAAAPDDVVREVAWLGSTALHGLRRTTRAGHLFADQLTDARRGPERRRAAALAAEQRTREAEAAAEHAEQARRRREAWFAEQQPVGTAHRHGAPDA